MLTGSQISQQHFRVVEDQKIPDLNKIDRMLKSGINQDMAPPIYVVRNFIPKSVCSIIEKNFNSIIEESGGNRIEDFVKVHQVGSTQFQKRTTEYFNECSDTNLNVARLLDNISQVDAEDVILEKSLRDFYLKKNIYFGPSFYRGRYCNLFTARLWRNDKDLSLLPHEDLAQLEVAQQEGFEIGQVKNVVAVNLCVQNDQNAELLLWNISPDRAAKEKLNLEYTGYPYPLSLLEGHEHISLRTSPGDLYFINANYIHAVSKTAVSKRISFGRFFGYTSENRIVYWT